MPKTKSRKVYIEVKGVTLEDNDIAMFPDAPTLRGLKHVNELVDAKRNGYDCYVFFVIQMNGIKKFTPNYVTHNDFGQALKIAQDEGVNILAYQCEVTPDSMTITTCVPVILDE